RAVCGRPRSFLRGDAFSSPARCSPWRTSSVSQRSNVGKQEGRIFMNATRLALIATAMLSVTATAHAQQPPPQSPNMPFFLASNGAGRGGDLGGLAGADAHCQKLGELAGAGTKTWRAYLSTSANAQGGPVNARDRIGPGPWQNFKGEVIAKSV